MMAAAATQPVSEVLELSLTDVVERALKNNVSILVQENSSSNPSSPTVSPARVRKGLPSAPRTVPKLT